jgi:hypothetical protein
VGVDTTIVVSIDIGYVERGAGAVLLIGSCLRRTDASPRSNIRALSLTSYNDNRDERRISDTGTIGYRIGTDSPINRDYLLTEALSPRPKVIWGKHERLANLANFD